jgi:hypothetical protein
MASGAVRWQSMIDGGLDGRRGSVGRADRNGWFRTVQRDGVRNSPRGAWNKGATPQPPS